MRLIHAILLATFALWLVPLPGLMRPAGAQEGDVRRSVVKIFTTSRQPDITRPWSKSRPQEATGSGVVLPGNRILTNAHVVNYASRILVQPYQSGDRYEADVIARSESLDLALLELEDESFFESFPAAVFVEELPRIGSTASAYGYPIGGDELSVTEGIVSRIEYTSYNHGAHGLRIQVDTPLNPGNSGGPATVGGEVIGLVFSGISQADNIGYLIPTSEINTFLAAAERIAAGDEPGPYRGRPYLMDLFQNLENPALRSRLGLDGMEGDTTGMMVLDPWDDEDYPLKKWDVVTAIGDPPVDIDNTGNIQDDGLRLYFEHLCSRFEKDGKVPLSIIRDGQRMEVTAPVRSDRPSIFSSMEINNDYPSYLVYGTLVFTPVYGEHVEWLSSFLTERRRNSPIALRAGDKPETGEEGYVVAPGPMFPHRMNKGYELQPFSTVKSVNGVKIRNMRHFVETLRDVKDEYVIIEWYDRGSATLVFRRSEVEDATEDILDDNGIRTQVSGDLAEYWR